MLAISITVTWLVFPGFVPHSCYETSTQNSHGKKESTYPQTILHVLSMGQCSKGS